MNCRDIGYGTYDCGYNIMPPFRCGFAFDFHYVSIDKCLLPEVLLLWEQGIRTTGCCCGHGRDAPYIGVLPEDIRKMKLLGYRVAYNPCRLDAEDSFVPKTVLRYGEIQKGFNWWGGDVNDNK